MRANLGGRNGRGNIGMNLVSQNAIGNNLGDGNANANMSRNMGQPLNIYRANLGAQDVLATLREYRCRQCNWSQSGWCRSVCRQLARK